MKSRIRIQVRIKVKSWIQGRVKSWIRIRTEVMRIRNPSFNPGFSPDLPDYGKLLCGEETAFAEDNLTAQLVPVLAELIQQGPVQYVGDGGQDSLVPGES
jgi:hypothetical protein